MRAELFIGVMLALAACGSSAPTMAPEGDSAISPRTRDAGTDARDASTDARGRRDSRVAAADALSNVVIPDPDSASSPTVPGQAVDGSYLYGWLSYGYQVWVPGSYKPGSPAPLVVALHGCGQLRGDLARLSRLNEEADRRGFLVLYPEQTALTNPMLCWNTSFAYNEERDSGELAVVMGMLAEVRQQYSVDAKRIYVTGISSGAAMTSNLAACYMDVFAAAAVVAGPMYKGAVFGSDAMAIVTSGSFYDPEQRGRDAWDCSQQARVLIPVMNVQGGADQMVAAKNGEQVIAQFAATNDWADDGQANGSISPAPTDTTTSAVPGGYSYTVKTRAVNGKPLLRSIFVEGMGHTWSGGDPNAGVMGTGMMGGDVKGPIITPMIWDFFVQHQR